MVKSETDHGTICTGKVPVWDFLCSNLLVNSNVGRGSHSLHDLINHDAVEGSLEEESEVLGSHPTVTHLLSDLKGFSFHLHVSVLCRTKR